jgi:multiple sugar transport system substrate-binding protein
VRRQVFSLKMIFLYMMAMIALTLSTGAAKKTLTIHPWSSMGERVPGSIMEEIVAEYEALNPDVEIEIIGKIPNYEFLMKLMLMPQMPDIVECHLDWFPELMAAGIPVPLPPYLDAEARRFFLAPTLQPLIHHGRLYGIPTTYVLYSLGYHQDLFDGIGLDRVPQTWRELEQAARKATTFHADGSIARAGLLIPGARWTTAGESHTKIFIGLLRSNGGYYLDDQGQPGLDKPEAVETLSFMADLVRNNIAIADGWRDFAKQRSVMAIIPNYDRPGFQATMGESFNLMKTALIPRGKGDFATTQFGWGYFVPDTAQYPEEAWKFLEWYTMKQTSEGLTWLGKALALRYVPTNPIDMRVVRQQMVSEPFWEGFIKAMEFATPEPAFPQIFKRWELMGAALQPVMRLQRPPLEGLRQAQHSIAALMKEILGGS